MKNSFVSSNIDFIGFFASLLCAIHCAALPILLALAPLTGLQFLRQPYIEYVIILFSFIVAFYTLVRGYRQHKKLLAFTVVLVGFILIGAGHLLEWEERVLTSIGALMVAMAHYINWKHVRQLRLLYPECLHQKK